MADFGKLLVGGVQSTNSDYSEPYVLFEHEPVELTPTDAVRQLVTLTGYNSYTTYLYDHFTTISAICVYNRGTTGSCKVRWGSQTTQVVAPANTISFKNDNPDTISDSGTSLNYLYGYVGDYLRFSGTTNGDNDGDYFLQRFSGADWVLGSTETLVDHDPEPQEVTISVIRYNSQLVGPGEYLVLPGSIDPQYSLDILSQGSACTIELCIAGS